MWAVVLLLVAASTAVYAAPSPQAQGAPATPNKSAFVLGFDEITVESVLNVKGRSGPTPNQRQGRTKLLVVPTPGTPLNSTSASTSTSTTTSTTEKQ